MVHDVGKLKLSEYLYGRTDEALPEDEKQYMSMHSKISYDLLKKYDYSDNIMDVVLSHHECFDGSGYPNGLVGEQIPLGARILIMIDEIKNMDIRVFLLFQRLIHEDSTIELINNSRLDIDDLDISDILKISQD